MITDKNKLYITNMLEAATAIEKFLKNVSKEKFISSDFIQSAVIRKFEIIGEAAKQVSPTYQSHYPKVEWKLAAGMRDVLIHDYLKLDLNGIWKTAQKDIPNLKKQLQKILK